MKKILLRLWYIVSILILGILLYRVESDPRQYEEMKNQAESQYYQMQYYLRGNL